MPALAEEEIARFFPKLKAVFYAAGTVQGFARPFLNRGIRIFSAWGANAVPVAEFTVSQILLANKGFFSGPRRCAAPAKCRPPDGTPPAFQAMSAARWGSSAPA